MTEWLLLMTLLLVLGWPLMQVLDEDAFASVIGHEFGHFGAHEAMSMDQGGSTTMFVRGQGETGIVSNGGGGGRNIANGLFIEKLF